MQEETTETKKRREGVGLARNPPRKGKEERGGMMWRKGGIRMNIVRRARRNA